ncbi:MAG: hypothetical protein IPG21_14225 [Saprospiraceae bacterium]|nr:hypothetical protein [Candidatus Vicinibacter affinis]
MKIFKLHSVLLLCAILCNHANSQSNQFAWVKQFGDVGSDAGNCILVDASGI